MGKRKKIKGGLIRKQGLTSNLETYKVFSVNQKSNEILMLGTYPSLGLAEDAAKSNKEKGFDVYLLGTSNRVLAKV